MDAAFNAPSPPKVEHLQRHDPSCLLPMEHRYHNGLASACQVDGNVVFRELSTAISIHSSLSNDYHLMDPTQVLTVPAIHYDSPKEDLRTPYPSYGDSIFPLPTYPSRIRSFDSYFDGEKLSGVPTFTDSQQENQFSLSGEYVKRMDNSTQCDATHYRKGSVLEARQCATDTFLAFPEQVNGYPPPNHFDLETQDATKLESRRTNDTGYHRTYGEHEQASIFLAQPTLCSVPIQPAPLPVYLQPAPLTHLQQSFHPLRGTCAVPVPAPAENVPEPLLVNSLLASDPRDKDKSVMCQWKEEGQTVRCSRPIMERNVQEHLAEHGIKDMSSRLELACYSCDPPKKMKRESILRHFREVHLKQKRKPSTKKKKV